MQGSCTMAGIIVSGKDSIGKGCYVVMARKDACPAGFGLRGRNALNETVTVVANLLKPNLLAFIISCHIDASFC